MAPFSDPLTLPISLEGLSPIQVERVLNARTVSQAGSYVPGKGAVDPTTINNNAVFALFGLLGAGFVISSIWFFFWAKNGGFRWRKRDWDDYKSTVLRRKGPNGTILSGATKSTKLGDGSVVGSLGSMDEYKDVEKGRSSGQRKDKDKARSKQVKNSQDVDVRAYRHEKVAKVGGLNREADGSHHEPTISEASYHGARPHRSGSRSRRHPSGRNLPYIPGTESQYSAASDDSHRPLRSSAQGPPQSRHSQYERPIRQVPRSSNGTNRYSNRHSASANYTAPLDFSASQDGSVNGSEQTRNTKSYHHPIPGLTRGPMPGGFRREGARRDSLSDSDTETRRY